MKRISIMSLVLIIMFASVSWGAPGDTLTDDTNKLWQLVASGGISLVTGAMNGMPSGFQAASSKNIFINWMQVEFGQSGSLNIVVHDNVLYLLLNKIIGYEHDNARIDPVFAGPADATVVTDDITCTEDASAAARTVLLYEWDFVNFTESAVEGSVSEGTVTFADLDSGNYVVAFNDGASLPSLFLTVP